MPICCLYTVICPVKVNPTHQQRNENKERRHHLIKVHGSFLWLSKINLVLMSPSSVAMKKNKYFFVDDLKPCDSSLCEWLSVFDLSDFLCIWNTNFQTLQAGKEMTGKIYGQVGMCACVHITHQHTFLFSCLLYIQWLKQILVLLFSYADSRALERWRAHEPTTHSSLPHGLITAGQSSLSFQLLGADGGLYDFGRALWLLSTVTGLTVPPHDSMAVYILSIDA